MCLCEVRWPIQESLILIQESRGKENSDGKRSCKPVSGNENTKLDFTEGKIRGKSKEPPESYSRYLGITFKLVTKADCGFQKGLLASEKESPLASDTGPNANWPSQVRKKKFCQRSLYFSATAYLVQTRNEKSLTFCSGRAPAPSADKPTPCGKGCSLRASAVGEQRESGASASPVTRARVFHIPS